MNGPCDFRFYLGLEAGEPTAPVISSEQWFFCLAPRAVGIVVGVYRERPWALRGDL